MKTLSELDRIDTRIALYKHTLDVARTLAARSPNAQTLADEREAELLLDAWLDKRLAHTR